MQADFAYITNSVVTTSGEQLEITVEERYEVARGEWATVYRAKIAPTREIIAIKQVKETKQYKVELIVKTMG